MPKILDKNKVSTYREYFLSTNEFNRPTIWTDSDATYALLIRLILLNPGTYPDHPEMGVGLVKNYRYGTPDALYELQHHIQEQIITYLPQFINVDVTVELKNKELELSISIDGIIYSLTYNPATYSLSAI